MQDETFANKAWRIFILIFKGKDSIDEDGQGYKPADYSRR